MHSSIRISACTAALVLAAAVASPASAQTKFRYGHMNPPSSVAGLQADLLAKTVAEKTKGAVQVQVYPASQLGGLQEQAEGVSSGTMHLHHNTMAGIGSLYEQFAVLDTPYLYKDVAHLMRVCDPKSPVMQKLNEGLIKARGVRVYYTFYFGTRQLTASREIKSPKDLSGLKIRAIPFPIYMATVKGLGAVPTPIDFAEVPTALATKTVAGQENPVDTIWAAKLYESQSHLMQTGHIMGAEIVVVNEKAWQALKPEVRKQMEEAAAEVAKKATQMTIDKEAEQTKLLQEKGMKVVGPKEGLDLAAFKASVNEEIAKQFEAKYGDMYKQIRAIQ